MFAVHLQSALQHLCVCIVYLLRSNAYFLSTEWLLYGLLREFCIQKNEDLLFSSFVLFAWEFYMGWLLLNDANETV